MTDDKLMADVKAAHLETQEALAPHLDAFMRARADEIGPLSPQYCMGIAAGLIACAASVSCVSAQLSEEQAGGLANFLYRQLLAGIGPIVAAKASNCDCASC